MGKRSVMEDYRLTGRGGKGVINMKITREESGEIVAVNEVIAADELIMITVGGQTIRMQACLIVRVIGRNTQGVKLFDVPNKDKVTAVSRVAEEDEDDDGDESDATVDLSSSTDGENPVEPDAVDEGPEE
jgi:DNA gyrase subunit A